MGYFFYLSTNLHYYELTLQKWCSDSYMIHGLSPHPTYCEEVEYNEPDE